MRSLNEPARVHNASVWGAATWPVVGRAQQLPNSYRVAYLALIGDEDAVIVRQRLGELGYTEGNNLIFDFRSAERKPARLSKLAADLVDTKPHVLVAGFGTLTQRPARAPPPPQPPPLPPLAPRSAPGLSL